MKHVYALSLAFCFLFGSLHGQKTQTPVLLKNGALGREYDIMGKKWTNHSLQLCRYKQKYYALVRFDVLPGPYEKSQLADRGLRLFEYLPANSYMAEISDSSLFRDASHFHINGIFRIPAERKIAGNVSAAESQDERGGNSVIALTFFGSMDKLEVVQEIQAAGAQVLFTKIQPTHTIFIKASPKVIEKIAELPFVIYINRQVLKDFPLNYNNRAAHGLDALSAFSGRNLQGDQVAIGIGDNSDPSTHIDFTGRLIQRNPTNVQIHGTHTAGTTAGAGILNPKYKGMAPNATLISQYFSDVLVNAPIYINDYDMVITTNSYFSGLNYCPGEGEYDALANYVDQQMDSFPSLLHVFAAGNDGSITCSPFPAHFATIKSGFQCGKNILSVGNLDNSSYIIFPTSSIGPVNDGRIKPEIVAGGTNIISTFPYNTYGSLTGTSMSSPTTAGTLALLYERYRQLHGGSDPAAALIKTIACNSADDLGNPGPDFIYGFGMLNARSAVETMEKNQYFSGSVGNSASMNYSISGLPAGGQQLKIMLYWPDAPAAPYALRSLVNNLDLTVLSPDGTTHHPMILDPSPAGVNNPAIEGIDSINNIEQVVINNPPAGNFAITVNGSSVPTGLQHFFIAYEFINPSVTLMYPYGNETWVPGETEYIRWTAYGSSGNTFSIDYSPDNGSTWNNISTTVPASSRIFAWTVPNAATNQALIRVTCNGLGYSDQSHYNFTILGQPQVTINNPCRGYAQLLWNTIPSASLYEIMMLKGDSMQAIANTTDTSFLLGGLNPDSNYWLGVRAYNNTTQGRRSISVNIRPSGGSCSASLFQDDFTVDSLIAPLTGRMFTSSQIGINAIQVELRNLGSLASVSPFGISYQVNGGSVVTESSNQLIGAGGTYIYTFSPANNYDFSAPGAYTIKVWIDYPGDPQAANDTLTATIKNLQNDPLALNPSFTEGFETAAPQSYTSLTYGFTGLDRCDFNTSTSNGRARTFINTGFARTGDRCATLDQVMAQTTSSTDSLVMTFNLSGYSSTDQIWLDYYCKNQGIDFILPGNAVWIRGNDQAAWVPVDTLSSNAADIGFYKPSKHIDVTGILGAATPIQSVTGSFQVKFGEQGFTSTNSVIPDGDLDDGYSFDDITLTRSSNDVGMLALAQPSLGNICNLSNAETISVQVKSYSNSTLSNIPVVYSINGTTVTESIPSIGPGQTLTYVFAQKADLSAYQQYNLTAWVSYPLDNYLSNDTLANISFQTTPLINSFPYLEGFENNNGYWYTQGINDDWQWGAPQKTIINRAANGTKAWVTNLTGNYADNQLSYLYSPCFDLSSLTQPELSFSHIFQTEDDCDCDYHWVEYSTDDSTWVKLGITGNGTNWYDNAIRQAWQLSDTIWHVSSYDIPSTGTRVRFRIVFYSDPATDFEGVGIDDVHIFDKVSVYSGTNIVNGITQPVSGSNWVNFDFAGQRVAEINPNGQDLGLTTVKLFIDTGAIRDTSNQYYLGRNIVVQPASVPAANVSVRFYFTDSESNNLIHATGCTGCTSIHDAYRSGVTQYSSPVPGEEDSTLRNDTSGTYRYLKPQTNVNIIPNANGYYAEYQVSGFSEFWINGGGPAQNLPLAATLDSFSAKRVNSTALLQWSTYQEINTSQFVVEKSGDSVNFASIGVVAAKGNTDTAASYQFIDTSLLKGNNYYRLKIMFGTGQSLYSPIRLVQYNPVVVINGIYPNPIAQGGTLTINTVGNCQAIELYDVLGRLVLSKTGQGTQNSLYLANLAKGVYFLAVFTDAGKTSKKILVN
jgi:Subtilase family/Secretion system C-terminal sorting domain